ncbi:MAG: FAD-dependent oxidoreductase, partial [Alphaproteobacteria bacterium]|nr:FAD-dependent oxidoreductase [Alphaproteobacteria bacterium]
RRPHAVVQLRQDNALGTLYNIVGFQTKLRHGAQKDVFRLIPGLEGAEFAGLGGIHRNTFINSPRLLDRQLRLQVDPRLRFAGQITGVEGYVESAAIGLIAGRLAAADAKLDPANSLGTTPPETTALGALIGHITGGAEAATFQPMNINFGLLPPLEPPSEPPSEPRAAGPSGKRPKKLRARERKRALAERALDDLDAWLAGAGKQLAAAQ